VVRRVCGLRVARPFVLDPSCGYHRKGARELSVQPLINVAIRSSKSMLERAGLPPIRCHDLRHSCLSLLAQSCQPIRNLQAQEVGGWGGGDRGNRRSTEVIAVSSSTGAHLCL
jgi:integrase